MNRNWLLVVSLTVVLVAGSVAGCGGVKTYVDPETTITIGVEDEFIIALDSNPTTGYDWEVSCDWYKLALEEEEYVPDEKAEGLVGSGGTKYFRFSASKQGETEITFTYKRSWETDFAEQKVFNIEIK